MNLESCPLNLDATLCCGQVFRWEKRGEWWYGVVGDRVLKVRQIGSVVDFQNVEDEFVKRYFSVDHDLHQIGSEIGKDDSVKAALDQFWGLRLIRQEPWECLISFICATYKSIAAIRQMLFRLSRRFGEKILFEGCDFYGFPTSDKLARTTPSDLESCGLGYRSKYVCETSKRIHEKEYDLVALKKMSYEQAKKELRQLPGVGPKVADCVLLFSLDKLEAFPVDIRVKRIIVRYYSKNLPEVFVKKLAMKGSFSNSDYEQISQFGRSYFGKYAGYAQEYLYHYERMNY